MTYADYHNKSLKILNEARRYLLNDFDKFQKKMIELETLCELFKKDSVACKMDGKDA